MTQTRDPDRLIRAFFAEGRNDLPDLVYDVVRSEIDQTRQRVVIGPARIPDMNTYAKLAIGVAAVVVVAVVGTNLLHGGHARRRSHRVAVAFLVGRAHRRHRLHRSRRRLHR